MFGTNPLEEVNKLLQELNNNLRELNIRLSMYPPEHTVYTSCIPPITQQHDPRYNKEIPLLKKEE